ncbi:MAG TPA: methyltransferase domain-containing protein [Solirubrobacteraceae bacterium]
MSGAEAVIWHDVECGRYRADLPLWRELAKAEEGPILDVGAGTGRVSLDLARRGHEVVALDREPAFLDALRARCGSSRRVQTVVGDAACFDLGDRRFGLIVAPMQTIQLLGGAGRAGFLRCARKHLTPHGLVACALADAMEAFDAEHVVLPLPDLGLVDGVRYYSQPVALRDAGDRMAIERIRTTVSPSGERSAGDDVIHLDKVGAADVEAEALAAGLWPRAARVIPPTDEHVGTTVVMLRG